MDPSVSWREAAFPALVAFVLTLFWYLAFGDVHLNVIDEGYLWYGVERTVEGQVPGRDFQAYDPGRYWWCAARLRRLSTRKAECWRMPATSIATSRKYSG